MQELTDDQLDGLFRKSAEEFEPPYDPAAWEAMNNQLDDRDRAAFWKKWLPWGIPLLLLLLMSGSWYVYHKVRPDVSKSATSVGVTAVVAENKGTNRRLSPQPKTIEPRQQESEPSKPTDLPKKGLNVESKAEPSGKTNQTENQWLSKKLSHSSNKPTKQPDNVLANTANKSVIITRKPATKGLAAAYGERVKTSRRNRPRQFRTQTSIGVVYADYGIEPKGVNRRKKQGRESAGNRFSLIPKAGLSENGFNTENTVSSFSQRPSGSLITDAPIPTMTTPTGEERSGLPDMATLSIQPAKWGKLMGLENLDVTAPERSEPTAKPVSIPAPQRGFSVWLAVAPDLSAVGLQNFTRPGTNLGALIEYRLASRWSVQTGVIWSMKIYKAAGDQYDADLDYWTKFPKKPEEISGQCSMLDIPVNVRYDVALIPRLDNRLQPSRWFVSGGVTSYVTLKEDYSYQYPTYTSKPWTAPSGGYGFSQLNLSIGYERALGRRLSWQVEPFLKAPLKGVGFFKIDLLSTGAFFSIRYKL